MPVARGQRALLSALRENLNLLNELTLHYDARTAKNRSPVLAEVHSPSDAAVFLKRDMENLLQEQLRVLVLDTKNRIRRSLVCYQGNVSCAMVRPCEVFRHAVIENLPAVIVRTTIPPGCRNPRLRTSRLPAGSSRRASSSGSIWLSTLWSAAREP